MKKNLLHMKNKRKTNRAWLGTGIKSNMFHLALVVSGKKILQRVMWLRQFRFKTNICKYR